MGQPATEISALIFMTTEDGRIKKRQWLKLDRYTVTNSLRSKLEASRLSSKEQAGLASVQNFILTKTKDDDAGRQNRIHSDKWIDACGSDYRRHMDKLEYWDEFKSITNYQATHDEHAFPNPYWIPRRSLDTGICTMEFRRQRLRAPVPDNHPIDDASQYALECLTELDVVTDADFWLPQESIHRSLITDHCRHIYFKDYSLRYGHDCRRLFHRVVMMPSEGRRNLSYHLPLVEFDVQTCHPFLLMKHFDDAGELKRYHNLITADIYEKVGDVLGVSRNDMKDAFLRVMNTIEKHKRWYKNEPLLHYFYEQFPRFTKSFLSVRTDLAIELQSFEADLMVQQLGAVCRTEGLFWIPQHDGFISTAADGEIIKGYAKKIIFGAVGFMPEITGEPLK